MIRMMIRIDIIQNTIFWPALYFPTSGKALFVVGQHVVEAAHPGPVFGPPEVCPPEAQEQAEEAEEQNDADPRMDGARVLPAAEQARQEEELRMEEGEAGHGEEHEARRRDPMVDAGRRRVAIDSDGVARMDLVARFHVVGAHDGRPSASRLAFFSSSGCTRLAPLTM